jgi:hypothetical protein
MPAWKKGEERDMYARENSEFLVLSGRCEWLQHEEHCCGVDHDTSYEIDDGGTLSHGVRRYDVIPSNR